MSYICQLYFVVHVEAYIGDFVWFFLAELRRNISVFGTG